MIVVAMLCSPSHGTSDSERIWQGQPCHGTCRTLGGVSEYIFPPRGFHLGYMISITPFYFSGSDVFLGFACAARFL